LTGPQATAGSDAQLQIARSALAATADVDLVLSPVSPVPTYPADWPMPSNDVDHAMDHIGFCMPYNMSGQPAISVNCGYTADGRPIGLQIAGRRFADRTVLAAADFYGNATADTDTQRPWPKIWQ
jgi:aspartyl-tRNA(Asn)/glutamyl-tRNA(Gln) amidotransferase subunit A